MRDGYSGIKKINSGEMERLSGIRPIGPEIIESSPYPSDVVGSLYAYPIRFNLKEVKLSPEGEPSEIAIYRIEGVFKTECGQFLNSKLFYKDGEFLRGENIIIRA